MTHSYERVLADELAAVRGELARLDSKCSTLTGLAGAGLAFLVTQTSGQAWPVRALLAAAGVALAASALVTLTGVLRPRLGNSGFCRYARMTPPQIRNLFDNGWTAHPELVQADQIQNTDLQVLSVLAKTKQRRFRWSVDLMVAGVALIGAGLAVGAVIA